MKLTKSKLKQIIEEELTALSGSTPEDTEVLIPGYGKLTIRQIKNRIMRDLPEIGERAAAGNLRGIGISRLEIMSLFLKTLEKHNALENEEGANIMEQKEYPNNSTMKRLVLQVLKLKPNYAYRGYDPDENKLKSDYDKYVRGTLRDPKYKRK